MIPTTEHKKYFKGTCFSVVLNDPFAYVFDPSLPNEWTLTFRVSDDVKVFTCHILEPSMISYSMYKEFLTDSRDALFYYQGNGLACIRNDMGYYYFKNYNGPVGSGGDVDTVLCIKSHCFKDVFRSIIELAKRQGCSFAPN